MNDYIKIYNEYLKKVQKKPTGIKEKIVNAVFNIHAHFTIKDLQNKIVTNKSVIEETLEELISCGLIRKIYFQNNIFYEQVFGHAHHDHIICINCNKIVTFSDKTIEKEQERISKEKGFELLKHSLLLTGICNQCKAKLEKNDDYKYQKEDKGLEKQNTLTLSLINSGETVEIINFRGGKNLKHRLMSMGINIGCKVQVLSNDFQGPFLLKINNTRIGIGHGLAHKISVKR